MLTPDSTPSPDQAQATRNVEEVLLRRLPAGMADLGERVRRLAAQPTTLLITGETGTGKARLARLLHDLSPRRGEPFLVVDCAALSPDSIFGELFGHAKDTFAGGEHGRPGRSAAAVGGTLLLGGVNLLSSALQGQLLQVLDERVPELAGPDPPQPPQARLIAASSTPLDREVLAGRFRADLYYRLSAAGFYLPPLRERRGAIAPLANEFLAGPAGRSRPDCRGLAREALAALERHAWPGNIGELRAVIGRAAARCAGQEIELKDLPEGIRGPGRRREAPAAAHSRPELPTYLRPHALARDARCVLCGAVHQQLFVAVVLAEAGAPVGEVCPRCLSEPPARRARLVWGRAALLLAEAGEALSRAGAVCVADAALRGQVEEDRQQRDGDRLRRAEDRRRREAERRERLAWPEPGVPEPEPATQQEKGHAAELLASLAEGVGLLRVWPTSLEALKQAERAALEANFPSLAGGQARQVVEARYQEFIARTA
jgi:transcriptional regulator with AAA-type ATPase domain